MPLHKLSQKSFVSGQYDRTAQNQESVSGGGIVATGLSYAKNVVSSDRGELRKRLGTKFLKQLDGAAVIVPFRMPDDDDVILLCNSNQIAGYKYNDDGSFSEFMIASGVAPTIPHDSGWDNSNVNGDYTVTCGGNPPEYLWGKGFNSDSWRQNRPYTPKWPYGTYYDVGNVSSSVNIPAWVAIESTNPQILGQLTFCWLLTCRGEHRGHYKGWLNPILQYSDDGSEWTTIQTGVYKADSTGTAGVSYSNNVISILGDPNTENRVQCIIANIDHLIPHKYWRIYFKNRIINNTYYNTETLTFFCYDIKYVSATQSAYTDTFDVQNLKDIKYAQNEQTMFIVSKGNKPIKIKYQNGNFTQTTFTAVDTYGTPACVEYFQNRLWFGGFSTMPNGVVASKFGAYETFTPSSPVQVDDAMELKCNQLQSQITNLKGGQKVLYCFSQDGISNIDGGSNGYNATSVQNIEFILKNRMPAGNATPAFKDDVMLYSSSDGTKLYGVDFDLLVNRFQVNDLAIYAKDVTQDKVTELHYVNNESKLVYGLTETGKMFSLLYEKSAYQGFFPQEVGTEVYDIAPIKVGRDYKLLMVVFRDGNWYLEEKLDCGKYIDTSTPRLTDEEKKWATYDNLENNIALDCYQTYDMGIDAVGTLTDTALTFDSDVVLEVDKTAMLGNVGSKEWVIVNIESKTDNQNYTVSVVSNRGNPTSFTKVYPEFTQFAPNLPQVASVGVISEGRYFNATHPDTNGLIYLPAPCHKVIYGVNYESLAILKIQVPYESLKQVAQVDVSVINTTHLEVGTDFSDTQYIEKIDDSSYYDLTRITMNDTYRVVVSDTPEMTKNVILRSNKGVPFTVNAVDMYINYSNLGGD